MVTGHFSEKLLFEGHFSGHTGSNDTGFEFLSCEGTEKKGGHTHRRNKDDIYIYVYIDVCVFVWPTIDSVLGGHTDMRPVSLEPVWQGGEHRIKKFSKK